MENLQISLNQQVMKLTGLNERGIQYVLGIMLEAKPFFSKSMMKRLIFKLN